MIRLAKKEEIPQILGLTNAGAALLIRQKIYQWSSLYPSKDVFIYYLKNNELYVLISEMDKEYKPVKWLTPS